MNVLVKIIVHIKYCHIPPPPTPKVCPLLDLEWLTQFEHVIPITCLFGIRS